MKKKIILSIEFVFLLLTILVQDKSFIHCFIYFFNILILLVFANNFYKGWYLLAFTVYIYSFPHLFNFFFLGENILYAGLDSQYNFIGNNLELNQAAVKYVNIFILGLVISGLFQKSNQIFFKNNTYLSRKLLNSLLFVFIFFLIIALQQVDFQSVKDTYDVPIGASLVFGIYYWINFVLSILFIYYLRLKIKMTNYFMFAVLLQLILFYLGVRQMTFWFLITIFLEFLLLSKINSIKFKINFKLLILGILTIYSFGIITRYRLDKQVSIELLFSFDNFVAAYLGYLAETSLTFYNLMASIYESSRGNDLFFFPELRDTLVMFIPAFLFPQKAEYLSFSVFSETYNVNPFGTYFIVGELLLSLRYKSLIFIFAVLYSQLGHFFYLKLLKNTNILKLSVYVSTLVLLFIRPVRGLLAPSWKIYITTVIFIYILIKFGNYFYSSKGKIRWDKYYYK